MGLALVTGPAIEPLTVAEVRTHLRIGSDKLLDPPVACDAALVASSGNVTAGEHRYRVTFVNLDGESDAGEISNAVTTTSGSGQVALTNIPLGNDTVTARRIYRTAAGGSAYLRLAVLADNTTTTYTDNIADGSLGAEIPVDATVAALIAAARAYAEDYLDRALITQTWRLTLDAFPVTDYIQLPRPSLLSVSSVTYVDENGTTQTLATTVYSVDTAALPGAVRLKYDQEWPDTRVEPNAVTITYTAGYGATPESVPSSVRLAMKLIVGDLYSVQLGTSRADLTRASERAIQSLLGPERHLVLA